MIYEIKTVDGVKTKVPLTGNGYGLPLGTIIAVYSNTVPDGFLPCNGTTYDTTTYSALYAYLGSNKLPDLRECVLVGAGQSDNEYDANDNPTGIQAHDIYTVGQFKDDQFQGHYHKLIAQGGNRSSVAKYIGIGSGNLFTSDNPYGSETTESVNTPLTDGTNGTPRIGTTTHGKQIGVNYCIKATPAYVEPDTVSDMVNTLRTQDSYSTSEVNTGKKWIDGKPIYRRTFEVYKNNVLNGWTRRGRDFIYQGNDLSIDELISNSAITSNSLLTSWVIGTEGTDYSYGINHFVSGSNHEWTMINDDEGRFSGTKCILTIEYTKTTD